MSVGHGGRGGVHAVGETRHHKNLRSKKKIVIPKCAVLSRGWGWTRAGVGKKTPTLIRESTGREHWPTANGPKDEGQNTQHGEGSAVERGEGMGPGRRDSGRIEFSDGKWGCHAFVSIKFIDLFVIVCFFWIVFGAGKANLKSDIKIRRSAKPENLAHFGAIAHIQILRQFRGTDC